MHRGIILKEDLVQVKRPKRSKRLKKTDLKKFEKFVKKGDKEWKRVPTKQKIELNLKFRDEVCAACKNKFRAGYAAEGYAEILFIGYHHGGMKRRRLICSQCVGTLLKVVGEAPLDILTTAPTALFTWDTNKDDFPDKPSGMMINHKHHKYNRKKLRLAVKKFTKKMKKLEPYSNIDYYKLAGLVR